MVLTTTFEKKTRCENVEKKLHISSVVIPSIFTAISLDATSEEFCIDTENEHP